jgi:hypothetical protein
MRFVFKIRCDGKDHQLEVLRDGTMVSLDHNLEMVSAFTAFGAAKPQCLMVVEDWDKSPEAFFKGDAWTRSFDKAFWEWYDDFEDDETDEFPLEGLPPSRFVDVLIYLLRYAIRDQESDHARVLAEMLFENLDVEKDVRLDRDVAYDDSGDWQSTYAYDHRRLFIKDVEVAHWGLATERRTYDPFTFVSDVENMEIWDSDVFASDGETPWAVNETLEALHIKEPAAAEPGEPADRPNCPKGEECDYAHGPFRLAVQYKTIFSASSGIETSESLLESFNDKGPDDIVSVAVRRTPTEVKEFDRLLRTLELAESQEELFSPAPLGDPELQALAEMDDEEIELHRTWRLIDATEVKEIAERELKKQRPSYGGW